LDLGLDFRPLTLLLIVIKQHFSIQCFGLTCIQTITEYYIVLNKIKLFLSN